MKAESSANPAADTKPPNTSEWLRASQKKPARAYLRQQAALAQSSDPPQATKPSYVEYLQSVSQEDLAALSEELAQETGWTKPYTHDQKRQLLRLAAQRIYERRLIRRHARRADIDARRRARRTTTTVERFTRQEIIDRDDSTCHLCGKQCDPNETHLDHLIPLARGGTHTRENVKVACAECNIRKGATMPSDAMR